jgi:uncharacterized protein YceK
MEVKMKKVIVLLAIILLLAGCSKEDTTPDSENTGTNTSADGTSDSTDNSATTTEGYSYEANGVTIPMNVDAAPIVEALGEPVEYFEAASCAFQGLDKIYYYNGFELGTYPSGDKDIVSYVNFLDDSVTTDKGIYLGSTAEEVIAAYGDDYTEDSGSYVYRLGETKLTFIVEADAVTSITYAAIVEGLNN